MNVLHLTSGGLNDGAGKGAYWLHQGLLMEGVNTKILTNSRETFDDPTVTTINVKDADRVKVFLQRKVDQLPAKIYKNKDKKIFSTGLFGYNFIKHRLYKDADIIHLHWINNGFVKIKHLKKINKPIVWTIRDMWPLTGGCHVNMGCERFKIGCGRCPQLGSENKNDLSSYIFKNKIKYLPNDLFVVGISPWISEMAGKSKLFHNKNIHTIYNNIDCNEFFPVDKDFAKSALNINTEKKLILAGATNLDDVHKGFDKFLESLNHLDPDKYFIIYFGRLSESLVKNLKFEYKSFGYLKDLITLRVLYSAADVFVAPSIIEAFGKTIAESMACGTPVVAFNATGPKNLVDHKINGYLAKPFIAEDLAKGIEWIVSDKDIYNLLSSNSQEKAINKFDKKVAAKEYIDLYKKALGNDI